MSRFYVRTTIATLSLIILGCQTPSAPTFNTGSIPTSPPKQEEIPSEFPEALPGCVKTSETDYPDANFTDSNCDGIDGEWKKAVFVSPDGTDSAPSGTFLSPARTIPYALSLAQSRGMRDVYVAEGEYSGQVSLINGISIYGKFESHTWQRSNERVSKITSSSEAILGNGITSRVEVGGMSLVSLAATQPGASTYAVRCTNCSNFILSNNEILAGNGADGSPGQNGAVGASGKNGGTGLSVSCDVDQVGWGGAGGRDSLIAQSGGAGGSGATLDSASRAGENAWSGALGGGGGASWDGFNAAAASGLNGNPGNNGTSGNAGNAGTGGQVLSGLWTGSRGQNGSDGSVGNGGGGGGGGGKAFCVFCNSSYGGAGGGGGGAGGNAGKGGSGGFAGGGSFGVFLVNSDTTVLTGNLIESGNGGMGGTGGDGGDGSWGGNGGAGGRPCENQNAGAGGTGGRGGKGGGGGGGGGGAGGISAAVYRGGIIRNLPGNTLITGREGSLGSLGRTGN